MLDAFPDRLISLCFMRIAKDKIGRLNTATVAFWGEGRMLLIESILQFLSDLCSNNEHSISELANYYSPAITAFASSVLAIITIFLWIENRSLRKAGFNPEVIAYLLPHRNGTGAVCLNISNVGTGPAFDIRFKIENDKQDFLDHNVIFKDSETRAPITAIPQGEGISFLFGIGFQLFGKINDEEIGTLKPFTVNIYYKTVTGHKKEQMFVLDIQQFEGLPGIVEKSIEKKSSESLEKIEKHLAVMARKDAYLFPLVDATKLSDNIVQKLKGSTDNNKERDL
ncbi:hypothetical protein [uncultured Cohaesibacter sp.]|uniref:hypothetical protein n=1 Tax=uncultured Cohaesibacter sp. TaxID=1002546 RepID=UPI0029C86EED|nr:hypothetical protein [uncultured Cohaesibacter sp.]